jgi:hypothetical protein
MRHMVERFTKRNSACDAGFSDTCHLLLRKGQVPDPPADPAPANGGRRIEELRIATYLYSLNTVRTVFAARPALEKPGKISPQVCRNRESHGIV